MDSTTPDLRSALAELVACKDLKEECERLVQSFADDDSDMDTFRRWDEAKGDYDCRAPLAWEAARRALAQPEAVDAEPTAKWALDEGAAELLKNTIGDDDCVSPVTLALCQSPDGYGLHVWQTDYPDEGSILLVPLAIPPSGEASPIPERLPKGWKVKVDSDLFRTITVTAPNGYSAVTTNTSSNPANVLRMLLMDLLAAGEAPPAREQPQTATYQRWERKASTAEPAPSAPSLDHQGGTLRGEPVAADERPSDAEIIASAPDWWLGKAPEVAEDECWFAAVDSILDIWRDGRDNPPESRCYVPGALEEQMLLAERMMAKYRSRCQDRIEAGDTFKLIAHKGTDEMCCAKHGKKDLYGMDEDEWSKPTHDKARAALAAKSPIDTALRQAEISHSGISVGHDKNPSPRSEGYVAGFGDCLAFFTRALASPQASTKPGEQA